MPRRTYTYREGYGFDLWNMVSTIEATDPNAAVNGAITRSVASSSRRGW